MGTSPRLAMERFVLAVVAVCIGLHVALSVAGTGTEQVLSVLNCSASVLTAVLCLLRALRSEADRKAWMLVATGLLLYSVGDIAFAILHAGAEGAVPTPSIADAFWLAMFPAVYAGVVLLLRRRLLGLAPTVWFDGLIAALGTAAIFATFVAPAMDDADGSMSQSAVLVAYVAGDFVLLSVVIGLICAVGWRLGSSLAKLAAGFLSFTVLDSIYLAQVAGEGYLLGTVLDDLWIVAMLFIALAAGPSHRLHRARHVSAVLLGMSLLFAAAALVVLVQAAGSDVPHLGVVLAAATIGLALTRVALLYYDVGAAASRGSFARMDELTGLPNRLAFGEQLQVDLVRAAGGSGEHFAVLLVDLDERFKEVNDSLGHATGDGLLRLMAERMLDQMRRTDTLARWGGDEFAVLLPDADREQAELVADRLGAALRQPVTIGDLTLHLGCSIGIALYPDHAEEAGELLRQADVAVIEARTTRNSWRLYRAEDDSHTRERLQMLDELRSALDNGGLVLHYQPKASLVTGTVSGVEALARWQHPTKGLLFPDVLIPLVEEAGLMAKLTDCVLRQALAQCAEWRAAGIELAVAVNLSAISVADETLPDMLADMLREYDLPAESLELEITEDSLLGDRARAIQVLSHIRDLGIMVSVDDYGTGYSSLAYLRDLPVHQLKLDRSFVFPMSGDPTAAAIVRSTIALAHSLGLQMVAEGVEDQASWEELNRYGCDQAQGYFLSRPVSAGALVSWLQERDAARSLVLEEAAQAGGES